MHHIKKINENDWEIDRHVPNYLFKSYEKEHGYVQINLHIIL
jgi:hypothetical protein